MWHSRVAALEVEVQDLEQAEEAQVLTESLTEAQLLHSHMAKQAEQRTAFLSKVRNYNSLNPPGYSNTCSVNPLGSVSPCVCGLGL